MKAETIEESRGIHYIERLRFKSNINDLELKRTYDAYKNTEVEFNNNPCHENREKMNAAYKKYSKSLDVACYTLLKLGQVEQSYPPVEASPFKVTFTNNTYEARTLPYQTKLRLVS